MALSHLGSNSRRMPAPSLKAAARVRIHWGCYARRTSRSTVDGEELGQTGGKCWLRLFKFAGDLAANESKGCCVASNSLLVKRLKVFLGYCYHCDPRYC